MSLEAKSIPSDTLDTDRTDLADEGPQDSLVSHECLLVGLHTGHSPLFDQEEWWTAGRTQLRSLGHSRHGTMARGGAGSFGGRDGPAPTQCGEAQCFDLLVRVCVACKLFRTPKPNPAAGVSSPASGTALQPQESVGAGTGPPGALPLPALLVGAPALLALALALALLCWVHWRRRRARPASPGSQAGDWNEPLDHVVVLSPGPTNATAPVWPPPEDPATTPPGHSVPVPATELGSTELVTTKTAGPEQL
ncbi:tumor necrosis factor receptor superfamily member 13C [Tenrec ecaudatus]|uniref:tumor necrosis factor receptor superfamily member 13C n=1 Tax=Tenrec ecaudatus TaxID=94439 RepID=UPI003F59A293